MDSNEAEGMCSMAGWLGSWRASLAAISALVALLVVTPVWASDDDPWPEIKEYLFQDRNIEEAGRVLRVEAPELALDAATVPIKVVAGIPQTEDRYIKTIHLVIDKNPSPIAGVFHMTPESGVATIATRIRVNEYTDVRAIAETSDGSLFMTVRQIRASGGCSAPALKDHEAAMARLGKMKIKPISPMVIGKPSHVQLMISHPNYSGLQMDNAAGNWIPPHFVKQIDVRYGDRKIMSVEGDISLSENPSIRFSFIPDQPGELTVEVKDTDDGVFEKTMMIGGGPGA
jgi:sulfur-oxidizing protein SoxY